MRERTNVGSQVLQVLPILEQLEPRLLLSAGYTYVYPYEGPVWDRVTTNVHGEQVWAERVGEDYHSTEIFSSVRGRITNDDCEDRLPSINDGGEIVWEKDHREIWSSVGGKIANGMFPSINNSGEVVWGRSGPGWGAVFSSVRGQLTPYTDGWWDPRVNDDGEVTWVANGRRALLLEGHAPSISNVQTSYDGDSRVAYIGRFVSGIDLNNTFTASASDADGDLKEVSFSLYGNTITDTSSGGGWAAKFNMGDLPAGTHKLQVTAMDYAGSSSETYTLNVDVVDFPSWLGSPDSDDYFSGGKYHLNGFFPGQLDISHTVDPDWWIVGGKTSELKLGVELGVVAGLSSAQDVSIDHEFVFEAKVLDYELFGYSADSFSFSAGNGVSVSFSGLANGDDLSLAHLSGSLSVSGLSLLGGTKTVYGPSMTVWVPIGFIPIPITVSSGMNFDLELDAQLNLGWNTGDGTVSILAGTYFEPIITAEPYLFGGLGIPVLNAGLEVGGELGLHYRGTYDSINGFDDQMWGTFALDFRAVATAGRKFTLAQWTVPSGDPWTFGDVPTGAMMLAGAGSGELPDILPWPNVTADGAGNVLLTRVVDLDGDPGEIDPEIFYAIRDSGGTWSALNPVATNDRIESDPDAAFDGLGGAVVAWVYNTIDPALVESTDWDVYLQTQEIYSSYFDGASWSAPQVVTSDSEMDGGPEVAFHNGSGLMLWEHAGGTGSTDLNGFDIHYAVWDDVTHTWGSPVALTNDSEGDWAPTVAFGPGGEAMAIWVHDADSNPTTADLYYATWNGANWSASATVPVSSTAGVREPRIAYASNGDVLLGWVGNEGGADILYTATWDHVSGTWSASEVVSGTPGFIEGLRLDISSSDQAILIWHGWDGENDLFSTTRDLAGGGDWTEPRRITSSSDGEWLASVAFDSADVPVTVWANENVTTVFGDGVDGIQLELLPNLETSAEQVVFDDERPDEGQTVGVSATISNSGWVVSEPTIVRFFLGDPDAGGVQIGTDLALGSIEPGDSELLSAEFVASAGENAVYVLVDPDEALAELSDTDNLATSSVFVLPDLTVSVEDISISNENPLVGEVVDIAAMVHNVGETGADKVVVRFYDGDPANGGILIDSEQVITALPADNALEVSVPWTASLGKHELFVMINEAETISEWEEANNSAQIGVSVLSDLAVGLDDLGYTQLAESGDDNVQVDVTVHNVGVVDATDVLVSFYAGDPIEGGTLLDSRLIPSLPAGADAGESFLVAQSVGSAAYYVLLDEADVIEERSEANNKSYLVVTVAGTADLAIDSGDVNPQFDTVITGESVSVQGTTQNLPTATDETGNFLIRVYDGDPVSGGDLIGGQWIETLNVGDNITAETQWFVPSVTGQHQVYVVVDTEDQVTEADEGNNSVFVDVEVILGAGETGDELSSAVSLESIHAGGGYVGTVHGRLNSSEDLDYFSFTVSGPTTLAVSLEAYADEPVNPDSVVLLDADGEPIISHLTLPDGDVFYIPVAGEYYIQARAADGSTGIYVLGVEKYATVIERCVFYNRSYFDGNDAVANTDDYNAIATDKQALLPGETASFANYSSYSRGINGIMIDIEGLAGMPSTGDFAFKAGNSNDPSTWATAASPTSITIRAGEGEGSSDRVTLIWSDNAIEKQWLQVTVLATANTGLAEADVFYFGNAVGEGGNSPTDALVNSTDCLGSLNNPHGPFNQAGINDAYDYNRDRLVNSTDVLLALNNQTGPFTSLRLITVPSDLGGEGASMAMAGSAFDSQDVDLTAPTAINDDMAILSSEPLEPLVTSTFSNASAGDNLLMGAHVPLAVETFEGDVVAMSPNDTSEETVDALDDVGVSDMSLELVVLNDLNADSAATVDGQAGLWVSYASETEAGDDTASVGLALDSILDELDPLDLPELRQLTVA